VIAPIGPGGKPLGLGVRRAAKALDEDEKGTSITGTLSGIRKMLIVSESVLV
jgi:hypothetical protein